MISPAQLAFLEQMFAAAQAANHKWPAAAACESAVETGWGVHTPPHSNNVLGIKAYHGWAGQTVGADGTEESPAGVWSGPQPDSWCVFPDYQHCFAQQMVILQEPRYAAALAATTIEAYIVAECAVWSTGHQKGEDVLDTYNAHKGVLQG